ncbi:sulfite exporter TauE/SafE family protein [Raineyella fluvialis]|uniref:Probable membrane transporter protein n=1 Tax=Raineyella fluvialis TaxID=2662261 RepID=A0A5Q2FDJ2_9ACTN|nr:sulfite exporter TauE/SafE family protein [Raineyella fluvialis]QGF22366.1 TSUP family transporter [Raineyella fluvialis]
MFQAALFHGVPALGATALALMALGGLLIGFSKTSFGGLGAVASAVYALSMPARESTAVVLLLLLTGDLIALLSYGRHVRWRVLGQLLPAVLPGLLLGAVFIRLVDDVLMRRSIAVVLLAMVVVRLVQGRLRPATTPTEGRGHWAVAAGAGLTAGFTTMVANAAAPVMSLYLLAQRFDKRRFLATNAWFFATVNLCKVPFAASVGLFTPLVFGVTLVMLPAVLVGAAVGRLIIRRVTQQQFELVTVLATAAASVLLLVR